jgi:DNA-binding MarR family transcriptional regulator
MPSAAKTLFAFAALNADEHHEFALSIHDIADAIGIGTASVSRSIAKLEEAGYITRKARTYQTERNVINIAPPLKTAG